MHILLPSDVFPPGKVGGAARSVHTLARALVARGHTVQVLVPERGAKTGQRAMVDDIAVVRLGYQAPAIPFLQNYFRHERLWPRLADLIVSEAQALKDPATALIIHAQHVQSVPAAVIAGRRLGVPVVATVRDHWPWDYFAIGLHGDRVPYPCNSAAALLTDLPARLGPLPGIAAAPAIFYMLAHMRRRIAALARADAIIAVSAYIARRLESLVPAERVRVIHNMVDIERIEQIAATPPAIDLPDRFLLFAGKLEANKGAGLLPKIMQAVPAARRPTLPPLVIAGDGVLRLHLEQEMARLGIRTLFPGWVAYEELLRLMARCELVLFPSLWGEPLSRVPIEAGCLGAPVVAMPTGGTAEIVIDGLSGALSATPEGFAHRLLALLEQQQTRQTMGDAARQVIRQHFGIAAVIPQFEALYEEVCRKHIQSSGA